MLPLGFPCITAKLGQTEWCIFTSLRYSSAVIKCIAICCDRRRTIAGNSFLDTEDAILHSHGEKTLQVIILAQSRSSPHYSIILLDSMNAHWDGSTKRHLYGEQEGDHPDQAGEEAGGDGPGHGAPRNRIR